MDHAQCFARQRAVLNWLRSFVFIASEQIAATLPNAVLFEVFAQRFADNVALGELAVQSVCPLVFNLTNAVDNRSL
jgi:hypothetical protein